MAREVTVPANTRLTVTLATPVASEASLVEVLQGGAIGAVVGGIAGGGKGVR